MSLIDLRDRARSLRRLSLQHREERDRILPSSVLCHSVPGGAHKQDIKLEYLLQSNDPYIKLLSQFCLLKQVFPDFPTKMLTALLLKEEGAGKNVATTLIEKGWQPSVVRNLAYLSKRSSEVFCCNYYWGKLDEKYLDVLDNSPPGSYLSVVDEKNKFMCCFKNQQGKRVIEENVSPILMDIYLTLNGLDNPLIRPKDIPLIQLAPALQTPTRKYFKINV